MIPPRLIAFGELGLGGEVRPVSHIDHRIREAGRLGFTEILLPARSMGRSSGVPEGVRLTGVRNLVDVLRRLSAIREESPAGRDVPAPD